MRGKEAVFIHQLINLRITPAHAGKSSEVCFTALPIWDHPRACGEKVLYISV